MVRSEWNNDTQEKNSSGELITVIWCVLLVHRSVQKFTPQQFVLTYSCLKIALFGMKLKATGKHLCVRVLTYSVCNMQENDHDGTHDFTGKSCIIDHHDNVTDLLSHNEWLPSCLSWSKWSECQVVLNMEKKKKRYSVNVDCRKNRQTCSLPHTHTHIHTQIGRKEGEGEKRITPKIAVPCFILDCTGCWYWHWPLSWSEGNTMLYVETVFPQLPLRGNIFNASFWGGFFQEEELFRRWVIFSLS